MEGSPGEDLGAPGSWEMADLDERMRMLLVSPPRRALASPSLATELAGEVLSPPVAASGGRGVGITEEVLSQVDEFLREALEKPRERLSILRMEQDIEKFICDPTQQQLEFQSLPTSYLRLAAHRVAQHYYLQSMAVPDNNLLDGSGSRIVLRKTSECRLPLVRLADIPVNLPQEGSDTVGKVAIKQRPDKCSQTISNINTHSSKNTHQRTVEERKEEYDRARARIFSSNSIGGSMAKVEVEPTLPDGFQPCSFVSSMQDEKTAVEGSETPGRALGDSSSGINVPSQNRTEKESDISRFQVSNRVAIFRDREVDRKDPDYDRRYERYTQRFDPGFGFSGGPYTMQPMYTPAVNYNTEFPQLGSSPRPQISMDHQPWPIPLHPGGPWLAAPAPNAVGYGPPEAMMTSFNPSHVGAHAASSIYMHSSQYPVSPQPGMPFVQPQEHVQPFAQSVSSNMMQALDCPVPVEALGHACTCQHELRARKFG